MHEAAIAEELLKVVLEQTRINEGKPVVGKVSCGYFYSVNEDVLGFAFDAISAGTVCEGMKMVVEHKPLRGHCKSCGIDFEFDITNPVCGGCGSGEFEMPGDEPLVLEEIEFETE
ncbi:MAG TPA: hydrogenase maturation nickel metallochaperone HypA [Sedimentisphaerales bacterium]|nr:hydrogenase maturation nickel metallochaperone HypA [Sedimentisphaerales bacterium]